MLGHHSMPSSIIVRTSDSTDRLIEKRERIEQLQDNAQSKIRNRRKRKGKGDKQKDQGMLSNLNSFRTKDITEAAEAETLGRNMNLEAEES